MKNYKNTFLAVPLYCVIAGISAFHIVIALVSRFAIITLPDGTITTDDTKTMAIYALLFVAVLLIGKKLFRSMTKKELFVSASIMAAFQLIVTLIQYGINKMSLTSALIFLYLSEISEWSRIISLLLFRLTNNIWIGTFIEVFAPYLFVLFGLKDSIKDEN